MSRFIDKMKFHDCVVWATKIEVLLMTKLKKSDIKSRHDRLEIRLKFNASNQHVSRYFRESLPKT